MKLDWKSVGISIIAFILLTYLLTIMDFMMFWDHINQNPTHILYLSILYLGVIFQRLLRNYYLFSENNLFGTRTELREFIPDGLVAGVFATYGPLKSGELIAMEIYHDSFSVDRGEALSTIILGRIFDILIVLALIGSGIFLIINLRSEIEIYLLILSFVLVISFIILLSEKVGTKFLYLSRFLFQWRLVHIYTKLSSLVNNYYQGIRKQQNPKSWLILILLTLTRWGTEIFYFSVLFSGFNFGLEVIQILPFVGLTYAIGVSSGTPGGLGSSQLTGLGVLMYYGINFDTAAVPILITTAVSVFIHFFIICIVNFHKGISEIIKSSQVDG